jgi:hypothetical protein
MRKSYGLLMALIISVLVTSSVMAQKQASDPVDTAIATIINQVYELPNSLTVGDYTFSVNQNSESRLDVSVGASGSFVVFGSRVLGIGNRMNNIGVVTQGGIYFDNVSDGFDEKLAESKNFQPSNTTNLAVFTSKGGLMCVVAYERHNDGIYGADIIGLLVSPDSKSVVQARECGSEVDLAKFREVAINLFTEYYPRSAATPEATAKP